MDSHVLLDSEKAQYVFFLQKVMDATDFQKKFRTKHSRPASAPCMAVVFLDAYKPVDRKSWPDSTISALRRFGSV